MVLKVLKISSLLLQSFKGDNDRVSIALLPFLNRYCDVTKNLGAIVWNWVHFLIQQPRNIQNQFTDLKQLKKVFLCIPVLFVYQCYFWVLFINLSLSCVLQTEEALFSALEIFNILRNAWLTPSFYSDTLPYFGFNEVHWVLLSIGDRSIFSDEIVT